MSVKKPQVNKKGTGPLRERRRQTIRRRRLGSPWVILGAAGAMAVVVIFLFKCGPLQASVNLPSDTELASAVQATTHIDDSVFEAVGNGDLPSPLKAMNTTQRLG